ncbi:MAG: hypothetical protein R3B06_02630 [Kofleriaceae bacterium]
MVRLRLPHLTAPVGAALLAALAAGACSDAPPVVVVHVAARPAVADVTELTAALTNGSSMQTETFAVAGRRFPLSFSVQTPGRDGDLVIDLVARDGAGLVRGAGAVTIGLGDPRVDADVTLEANDFVVNTTFVGSQDLAFRLDGGGRQLTVDSDGVFTIGWSDTCQMVGRCDVFGRRFDATGTPVDTAIAAGSGQFNLNQSDGETGFEPSLVTNRTGGNRGGVGHRLQPVRGGDRSRRRTRHVERDRDHRHDLAGDPGGDRAARRPLVVAWTDTAMTPGGPAGRQGPAAQLGSAPITNPVTGTTGPFVTSTTAHTTDETPAVVALDNSSAMAVVWRDGTTIRGRFFGATGTPLGGSDLVLATRTPPASRSARPAGHPRR